MARLKQQPIRFGAGEKRGVSTQFGALCYRIKNGKVQVLLITSRGSGRWLIPKGWPMDNKTPADTAKQEAYEEAGVEGKVVPACLGIYSYTKRLDGKDNLPCVVSIFPVKVKKLLKKFPESEARKRKWFSQGKAAKLVDEAELSVIIRQFDPSGLPG